MRRKTLSLLIVLAVIAGSLQAVESKYQSVKGDPMKSRIYTLSNGLKVYLTVNKEQPRIQTLIAVRVGSKNDPAETTGLSHYLEHLMFKGTTHFGVSNPQMEAPLLDSIENRYEQYRHTEDPAARKAIYHKIDSLSQVASQYNIPNEYDKLMAAIGSTGSNAYTSNDVTCYTEDIPANEMDNWAKIQSDRFMNMTIRGFHTELEAVYEEKNISMGSDDDKSIDSLFNILYPNHPYGTQSTIGRQTHLKNPSIVNIKNHFHNWYVPNNIAICMSGDLDPDATMAIIEKYFGEMKPNPHLPVLAPREPVVLTRPESKTVLGNESEYVTLGWRFNGAATQQADTLQVLCKMLNNDVAGLFDLDLNQKQKVLNANVFDYSLADYCTMIVQVHPRSGQTLDEARTLVLAEINKLKKGNFSNGLLPAVINNMKRDDYQSLENNRSRADKFVDAFINGREWSEEVNRLARISTMTKKQLVAFANKYLTDGYAVVYKKQGEDPNQKKIEKPEITPIKANREMSSQFLRDIQSSTVVPITPRFVDFAQDMTVTKTSAGLPVCYKQNRENGLFTLSFNYDFGANYNKLLTTDYLDFVGTDKLTATQVKQTFYQLACDYNVSAKGNETIITLSGLNENLQTALTLLENVLNHAKADKESYNNYLDMELKSRADSKTSQRSNFMSLNDYGVYGAFNPSRQILTDEQLRTMEPQNILNAYRDFQRYKHTILYYGPSTQQQLLSLLAKVHHTAKTLQAAPAADKYKVQYTHGNRILIAPYEAKNIYMEMINCSGRNWSLEKAPVEALFNEYFGSGMNTIVFQEMRETRGLAYSASARYNDPYYKGSPEWYNTFIITQNDKMMDCINEFEVLLDKMPLSQSAFELAKSSLEKRLASTRVTGYRVLTNYMDCKRLGIDTDKSKYIYEHLSSLNLSDIDKFAKENVANKAHTYIILGDEKNLDMKSLERIAPVQRISIEEIFGY